MSSGPGQGVGRVCQPDRTRSLKQAMGANNIGLDKGIRPGDRAVNMRLGSKMHQGINPLLAQQQFDQLAIADIALHKTEVRVTHQRTQSFDIAGIGQGIQHHDAVCRMVGQPVVDKVSPDKAGTAGNKQFSHDKFLAESRLESRDSRFEIRDSRFEIRDSRGELQQKQ